jgi:hypothetical protein
VVFVETGGVRGVRSAAYTVIERVAQHQSRFRTPGLGPDNRGVALGPVGLVLVPSLERLVAFLRAAGEEGALDELLDSLRIAQVISPLRTRELVVEVQAGSSHRMDRLSSIARLIGAMVFTGSGRHYVKYRDAQAPFGYDIAQLMDEPGDLALYHDRFAQPYKHEKDLPLRDLLLRLAPVAVPRTRAEVPRTLYALVRHGLGDSVVGYLARWSAPARVAVVEWVRGGTSDVIERAWLLVLHQPAPRYVGLLRSLPGVRLFVPDGERTAVELGHRHPVPLSACAPLFGSEELVLFRSGGDGPVTLPQRPPFVDVQTVTSLIATTPTTLENARTSGVVSTFSLPLKLVPSGSPPRRVAAALIPLGEQDTLGRMLSVLPPAMLNRLQVAFTENTIYLYGPEAASAVPLGTLYEDLGENVLIPLGWGLSPPIPADVLRLLSRAPSDSRLFVTHATIPIVAIPNSAFVSATRVLLGDVPVDDEVLIAPPLDTERPLPDLWPTPPGLLSGLVSPGSRGELPPPRVNTTPLALDAATPTQGDGGSGG